MNALVPVLPDSAPFTPEQRAWLNGFLAGLFSRAPAAAGTAAPPAALMPLTIVYGSQTGTAEGLARRAAKSAGQRGFAPTVLDLAQCDLARLAAEKQVLVITSTYGDGEPPDNARALHAQLAGPGAELPGLRFSVCALGDTNYTRFCQCGIDFDRFLERAGATRLAPRADCDLDYEAKFTAWLDAALAALGSSGAVSAGAVAQPETSPEPAGYSRTRPFPARLVASRNLSGTGSAKQVHHVVFDLAGSGLSYEAGDALGVVPHNCPALVDEVLLALGCDGEEAVPAPDGSTMPLRRALTECYDLGRPSPELAARLAPGDGAANADGRGAVFCAPAPRHVIDLLAARAEPRLPPADFVRLLKRLQPRLYSISSSPRATPGEVHLTVGVVRYALHGRARLGVCSTYLATRAVPGESRVGVYVHHNPAFRPPPSGDIPMIMVGPGTGIAPFRAFLQERQAAGARGRNWLFFGDQRAATDFLYHDELAALQRDGLLTRLDTAFSRDQAEKIYVQNRLLEHATEVFAWLEAGAHFYVCGDAQRMAKDVDAALHTIITRAGGRTPEEAAAYVRALGAAKRYARDVY
ncbi:MAG: sulfite reductase subunit alpha [Verrucomicrobia bacterium]|nr:sulfite reductase subunit alpha [Verrucomicrobiota bacterium]